MSCNKFFKTTGVAVAGSPLEVLPHNIHRKALFVTTLDVGVTIAIGESPAPEDYFPLAAGSPFVMDTIVPAGALWATGTGILVYGEST